jgi:ankyrin repeat protein
MVKFLLEAGADQEHKTDEMHTALMEASMDGHVEVARLLLDSGAQVNIQHYYIVMNISLFNPL